MYSTAYFFINIVTRVRRPKQRTSYTKQQTSDYSPAINMYVAEMLSISSISTYLRCLEQNKNQTKSLLPSQPDILYEHFIESASFNVSQSFCRGPRLLYNMHKIFSLF